MSYPSSQPLLTTKLLIPRLRQSLVLRPRLAQTLDAALDHPLLLISAPAGFGKTTLAAAWAQQQPLPVAWLALDAADNDPHSFLRYLLAALQTAQPTVGRDLAAALEAGHAPPIETALIPLINDLAALPGDVLLVLDDFHLIDNGRIEESVRTLVEHQPPQLHLLILTREDPPLPLARLRARGQMIELRAHDLRFTPEETAAFLRQVMGLTLSPQQVAALDTRIEGWVAGLQLAGLSLQKSADPAALLAGLSSKDHFILTYLTEEVLRRQPPDVQDFLLQTSILQRLAGPLCDAVCERRDSAAVLAAIYAANAFVAPLDAEHTWFRYHPLFGELLREQLRRTQPDTPAALHRRAADWFAAQAQPVDAIEHLLQAGDYGRAAALLELHARPLVLQGYAQTVAGWLGKLPSHWRMGGPHTNVAFAWSLLLHGQVGEMDRYLANAEAGLAAAAGAGAAEAAAQASVQAEILALRAAQVSLAGEPQRACDLARDAVALTPEDDLYVQGATRFCLATACNYAGRTVEAIAAYQEALPLCRAAGNTMAAMLIVANLTLLTIDRGQLHAAAALCQATLAAAAAEHREHSPALAAVYGALAHVRYEWNELDEALELAQQTLDLARRSGHIAALAYGSVTLSMIQAARGEVEAAGQLLAQAQQSRDRTMPAWVTAHMVRQAVHLALLQDDEPAALAALEGSGVPVDAPTGHMREIIHVAWLRLLLHRLAGRPALDPQYEQARQLAGRIIASATAGGRSGRVLEALILRALVYQGQGEPAAAAADLQAALRLAAPEGYTRVFAVFGGALAHLLAALAPPPDVQQYVVRLRAVLAPAGDSAPAPPQARAPATPPPLVETLSEREIEVLHLLAEGLTYQEVAARLIVSLNTVRFHVKSIYGKLGADNRTAALEQARRRGYI